MRALLMAGVMVVSWLGHAQASLIGSTVDARYLLPDEATVIDDAGAVTIANGTRINFLNATLTAVFGPDRIVLTTNAEGSFAPFDFNGIELLFSAGAPIVAVSEDPSSSPAFARGSVLTFTSTDIRLNLSNTCDGCLGGESIVLNVLTGGMTAVPEPAAMALLGFGVAGALATRRRQAA